ncbi:MAG TPA: pilus assembly protein PilP [Ideonella sp.]|uniref:pilus assembly protein PilP n=1 Tax=Ideonella sp. TaxID=1929293 RepID=UPI002C19185B|nr:pilus assembly protein PilP [Ideonella sp.]HSI49302.1 pilus assembly protein PilP [Ideonella sp.]
MSRQSSTWLGLVLLFSMAGCSGDNQEIQAWMDQQAKEVKPNVQPISPPRKFEPEPYVGSVAPEPFGAGKMVAGTRLDARGSNAILTAEMRRRKQPLESYPLDGMKMVGSVNKSGQPHALLKVQGLLHYVKAGDYLGQNFGKIIRISETELELREIVQDASGEWIERTSTLQLQESGQ